MPNNISNAIGTARQFTPQPDTGYVGNYQGVRGSQVGVFTDSYTELGNNLLKLNDAFQNYMVSHEKYKDATGHMDAERMLNGMTPADIKHLNAIDAAQQEGYVDQSANPYFKAYAEKLRGQFLSTQMKNEYDREYAMNPAKSMGEEAQRYAEFSSKWKTANLKGNSAPANPIAFNDGFDENQLVNINNLAGNWVKKKTEEDVVTTIANVRSELGATILAAPELLKMNGALTAEMQRIFNETRLMGVPIQHRQKLLEDFTTELVKTGKLNDWTRFQQMMDNVTIQTSMDGSSIKASDLLDMQTYKTANAQFNRQFHTQAKYDWAQRFIKMGVSGKIAARKAVEAMMITDADNAPAYNDMIGYIDGQIAQNEAQKRMALRSALKGAGGNGSKSKITDTSKMDGVFESWCRGDSMYGGMPIGNYKFDDAYLMSLVDNQLRYTMSNQQPDMFFRVMDMPQLSKLRDTIKANMKNKFATLRPSDDGGVNIGGDEEMMNFFRFMYTNANNIENSLGSEVARDAGILKSLVDTSGDFDTGLRMMSYYTNASNEDISNFRQQIEYPMAGLTTEGVENAGSGLADTVDLDQNPMLKTRVCDLAVALMCQGGYSATDAVQVANRQIQQNYYTYHWGAFPKGIANNLGIPDPIGWFTHGIDMGIWEAVNSGEYAGAEDSLRTQAAEQVHVTYNDNTQTFEFNDWAGGGHYTLSLNQVREKAKADYQKAIQWYVDHPASSEEDSDDMSLDAINAARVASESLNEDNVYEEDMEKLILAD